MLTGLGSSLTETERRASSIRPHSSAANFSILFHGWLIPRCSYAIARRRHKTPARHNALPNGLLMHFVRWLLHSPEQRHSRLHPVRQHGQAKMASLAAGSLIVPFNQLRAASKASLDADRLDNTETKAAKGDFRNSLMPNSPMFAYLSFNKPNQ